MKIKQKPPRTSLEKFTQPLTPSGNLEHLDRFAQPTYDLTVSKANEGKDPAPPILQVWERYNLDYVSEKLRDSLRCIHLTYSRGSKRKVTEEAFDYALRAFMALNGKMIQSPGSKECRALLRMTTEEFSLWLREREIDSQKRKVQTPKN